jgi:CheY-like chemotaxis protein
MLKRGACHYAEAVDGADAVIIFDAFQPDLVLLDINMPVLARSPHLLRTYTACGVSAIESTKWRVVTNVQDL